MYIDIKNGFSYLNITITAAHTMSWTENREESNAIYEESP
jgi:hypothetical protein